MDYSVSLASYKSLNLRRRRRSVSDELYPHNGLNGLASPRSLDYPGLVLGRFGLGKWP